jgi:hypothetical protein
MRLRVRPPEHNRRVSRRLIAAAVLGALTLSAAGCGTTSSERDARASVQRFYSAFQARDGAAACRELSDDAASALETSEGEPCEKAVLSLKQVKPAPVSDESVWVTSAEVRLRGGATVFLDQIDGRWRISAAGCEPQPGQPYECELEG